MLSWLALVVFVLGYALVITEELTGLRKSTPMVLAAAVIWMLVGLHGEEHTRELSRHALLEFGELFLFLLSAMTYVNTLEERGLFDALRRSMVQRGLTYVSLFWICGALAFVLSAIFDNLTTALLVGSILLSVGKGKPDFQARTAISVVIAANAGGAFSPFGDITTLMLWQAGKVEFLQFFQLFLPSLVNWLVPALWLVRGIPSERAPVSEDQGALREGAFAILALFLLTIGAAVAFQMVLQVPPVFGMLGGLAGLELYGQYLARKSGSRTIVDEPDEYYGASPCLNHPDVFAQMQKAEWDTLLFFGGVILCISGLQAFGWLSWMAEHTYSTLGATYSNVGVGLISAILDNIPVMAAVLSMNPEMSQAQWLLIALTAGVGGSLLSLGSAAGVALMGLMSGTYTFSFHLRFLPCILMGYAASVVLHLWLQSPG
jgi:Na+/H+ antiporter NhaD/arsenite permease-like protein